MPIVDDRGYSEYTPQKIAHLDAIFRMHLAITAAVTSKHHYWRGSWYHYIDATAGPGWCPELELKGSPLLFLDAGDGKMPFRADFIECNDNNYLGLARSIPKKFDPFVCLHHGRYEEIIPRLLRRTYHKFGLIFVDPTGQKPDLPTLELVAQKRPRMEILIYLSAATIKRCRNRFPDRKEHQIRLNDYIGNIDKEHWLVREPMGRHQWTFLLGSNTDLFTDYKSIQFWRADSESGQEILTHLDCTNEELEQWQQPTLPNITVMPNTSNIPSIGISEPRRSNVLTVSVSDAKSDR